MKLSKTLPQFKRRLKEQLTHGKCAACRFYYYRVYTYPYNFLVNNYTVIRVKLRFIIFTWIGLVIVL